MFWILVHQQAADACIAYLHAAPEVHLQAAAQEQAWGQLLILVGPGSRQWLAPDAMLPKYPALLPARPVPQLVVGELVEEDLDLVQVIGIVLAFPLEELRLLHPKRRKYQ